MYQHSERQTHPVLLYSEVLLHLHIGLLERTLFKNRAFLNQVPRLILLKNTGRLERSIRIWNAESWKRSNIINLIQSFADVERNDLTRDMWNENKIANDCRWIFQTICDHLIHIITGSNCALKSSAIPFKRQRPLPTIKPLLRLYYEQVFQALQQTNCQVIAKAWVKFVEPRKQLQFPYNGRRVIAGKRIQFSPDETKPPWYKVLKRSFRVVRKEASHNVFFRRELFISLCRKSPYVTWG